MTIKGIIFDLDGVLVFTDRYHYQAWKTLADSLKIPFDETINNRLRGVSRMESLEIILENCRTRSFSPREKSELAEKKNRIYQGFLEQMTEEDVPTGVRKTLTVLRERGYLLALGSSSKNARFIMQRTGLTEYFDAVSDGTNITKSKPDPEVFLKASEYLKLCPQECTVVEDAKAGIEAAGKAGMSSVFVGDRSEANGAAYRIHRVEELLDLFQGVKIEK